MTPRLPSANRGELFLLRSNDGTLLMRLAGAWQLRSDLPPPSAVQREIESCRPRRVAFDAAQLTAWDTGLLSFLVGTILAFVGAVQLQQFGASIYVADLVGIAMALDPEVLFFDEPSAGLDPISSKLLDDLILELRDSLGTTIVVVTHELASIFTIASNSVFLDVETRTMVACGPPKELLHSNNATVRRFLTRGADTGAEGTNG